MYKYLNFYTLNIHLPFSFSICILYTYTPNLHFLFSFVKSSVFLCCKRIYFIKENEVILNSI